MLEEAGIRTHVDASDARPGDKFYEWEKKGVPLRIELGPKDVAASSAVLVRRDTGAKETVATSDLAKRVPQLLDEIHQSLYDRALSYQREKTKKVDSWDEFVREIEAGNFVLAHWSGDTAVEKKIKEETGATIRCIPFDQIKEDGKCVYSGEASTGRVIFARAY